MIAKAILFLVTAAWALTVSYPYVLLAMACGLAHKPAWQGTNLTAEWRPWFAKIWHYSTTIGRGIIFHPLSNRGKDTTLDTRIEFHEDTHVVQLECLMTLSLVLGGVVAAVTGDLVLGFWIHWSGGAWQLPNFLCAVLRHGPEPFNADEPRSWIARVMESAYRNSEHERSAYAQTDMIGHLMGKPVSWIVLHEMRRAAENKQHREWLAHAP